jgi:hypothetical protein
MSFHGWGHRATGWTAIEIEIYNWAVLPEGWVFERLHEVSL